MFRVRFFMKIIKVLSLFYNGGNNQVMALVTADSLVDVTMALHLSTIYSLHSECSDCWDFSKWLLDHMMHVHILTFIVILAVEGNSSEYIGSHDLMTSSIHVISHRALLGMCSCSVSSYSSSVSLRTFLLGMLQT